MNLFETIPEKFFSILSSPNRALYFDALMLLHRMFQHELNIQTSDFITALIALLENRIYEIEDDDEISDPQSQLDDGGLTLNVKARLILNRFLMAGWVDREYMDGTFTEVITPRTYAIRVMQLLSDLCSDRTMEYNSLVFSTYSALKEARNNQTDQMYEAVLNAKSNTDKLIYELKSFYHGIRGFLQKIQGQKDINILLRDHFDEYKALVDRIYHPIKTMDSVHRYMAPIREILVDVLGSREMMDSMRKRAMSIRGFKSEEEAGSEIIDAINGVLDIYRSLGGIVGAIDKKHSNYTKLSVDTIRYHMSADKTISGKLVTLLKGYAASGDNIKNRYLNMMEQKIHVNRQQFCDGYSLWHRNIKSRRLAAEPLTINADARLSEAEIQRNLNSIQNDYSLRHIRQFINKLLGERDSVSTEDITISDNREFIMLLLAAIRAGERNINFETQIGTGSLKTNGYGIPKMVFIRKGESENHVE